MNATSIGGSWRNQLMHQLLRRWFQNIITENTIVYFRYWKLTSHGVKLTNIGCGTSSILHIGHRSRSVITTACILTSFSSKPRPMQLCLVCLIYNYSPFMPTALAGYCEQTSSVINYSTMERAWMINSHCFRLETLSDVWTGVWRNSKWWSSLYCFNGVDKTIKIWHWHRVDWYAFWIIFHCLLWTRNQAS